MAIPGIGALPTVPSVGSIGGTKAVAGPEAAQSFGDLVASGIQNVADSQAKADGLAQAAATGDLTDLHDYMIASSQAQLTTELTVTVRNKAVDAFNEIMRMQV
jgi:flagellar hook-basal body complex protein FliE